MDAFKLTRSLIDINSVTPNEGAIGDFLFDYLEPLARRFGGAVEKQAVEPGRNNIWAWWGEPEVVFSTHMDTVPPFIPSAEDDEFIWGRGACDTHGIAAAMLKSVERLLEEGTSGLGVLLVVGEEVDGAGACHANRNPPAARFLINGEPTENRLALASKGTLGFTITAAGRACHSAYPELGESATDLLLDRLSRLRQLDWPADPLLGETTVNIGTLDAGPAANIVADYAAASVMIRVVGDLAETEALARSVLEGVGIEVFARTPALRLHEIEGFQTSIVKYTTDIPKLSGWGQPLLIGPGSIHFAHTAEERIPKRQIEEAIGIYARLARSLKASAAA
ncbi:MAG: M20/M25/M40 family metallo-hydrolase [Bryobacterales bacterium]|nr:M20/M25/M40 family metallo-hydrolase [Bryobacterales bacterium]